MTTPPRDEATGYVSPVAYTYDWYERFFERLLEAGYTPASYDEPLGDGDLVVRHDVDLSPAKALDVGRIEADLGIESTFFFLLTNPLYNPFHRPNRLVIRELLEMGHDVGVHFSTHQYWGEDPGDGAIEGRVAAEREVFTTAFTEPSPAVSFHRPPEWILSRSFDSFVSTYERRFFTDVQYAGDSSQRWRDAPPEADGGPLQVLTHPGLWGAEDATFAQRVDEATEYQFDRVARFVEDEFIHDRNTIEQYDHRGAPSASTESQNG
ncbi:polysaccharide deacetylase family protein [Natronorarus salvus]|uniref:hypothetical protein n=1 Tax=Natronorarus salvus TaxID=3117733 RepID=UPI002F2673AE